MISRQSNGQSSLPVCRVESGFVFAVRKRCPVRFLPAIVAFGLAFASPRSAPAQMLYTVNDMGPGVGLAVNASGQTTGSSNGSAFGVAFGGQIADPGPTSEEVTRRAPALMHPVRSPEIRARPTMPSAPRLQARWPLPRISDRSVAYLPSPAVSTTSAK